MKKLLIAAAIAGSAVFAHAASVGWSMATGSSTYGNCAYAIFVIGQNGVTSTSQISELLGSADASTYTGYAFGTGTTTAAGAATQVAASSGKSLTADGSTTYTAFFALFDTETLTEGSSKYTLVSWQSGLTKTPSATSASINFTSGSVASYLSTATWSSYGAVPEPTSGLLMLVGLAGLALRRRRA